MAIGTTHQSCRTPPREHGDPSRRRHPVKSYSGGCSCGAVQFTIGRFNYVMACHCDACKKRTGSAYGLSVMVDDGDVTEFTGATKTFRAHRGKRPGGPLEFCPELRHDHPLAGRGHPEPANLRRGRVRRFPRVSRRRRNVHGHGHLLGAARLRPCPVRRSRRDLQGCFDDRTKSLRF